MRKAFILLSAVAVSAATLAAPALARGERGPDREPMTRSDAETRAAEAFARLDANRDGVLSPADREARAAAGIAEFFARADSDGNGELSLAEMTAAREARSGERRERVAERMAQRGPEGPRGEGRRGREGRRGLHSLAGIVRSADADGDKQISQAEFGTAALARFDRADADSDGTLTGRERRFAMRGTMRPMRQRSRD